MTPTTNVPAPVNTTQALELASFAQYDYSNYEVLEIGQTYHPLIFMLTAKGRELNRGDFKEAGMNEIIAANKFPEYKWDERDDFNDIFVTNWTINSSATTLVLDSTAGLYPNLILRNTATGEHVRITSVDSATQLTIARWVGETAAASITDEDKLQVVATASAAGVAGESSFFTANQHKSNYFQKMITTVSTDDFDRLTGKVIPKGMTYEEFLMADKLRQHAMEKEKAVLFGQKFAWTDAQGKKFYTMGWVVPHCLNVGYYEDLSGSLTSDTLEAALEYPLRYGSKSKIIMGSSKAIRTIKALYRSDIIYNDSIESVNLKFQKMQINSGDFTFVEHPELDRDSGYENYIFVLDLELLKLVYPTASAESGVFFGVEWKTQFRLDPTKTNYAKAEWSYITYMTLMRGNARWFWAFKVAA